MEKEITLEQILEILDEELHSPEGSTVYGKEKAAKRIYELINQSE